MGRKDKFGISNLVTKSFAILSASLTAVVINQSNATPLTLNLKNKNKNLSQESFQKRLLKPKLILKLNVANPEKSYSSMHASHSSHASHASHASYSPSPGHASHSSHISSSPSYAPSNSTPIYTPKVPIYKSDEVIDNNYTESSIHNGDVLDVYSLGSRVLYKGCRGTDVKELQILLINLGYDVPASGYFDNKTELAVKNFQNINQLKVDGKVGRTTLIILQSK
ncbi:MAG: peptidoglycan-binding domain-containing protein [Ginsengibacter sp.]